MAVLDKSFFFKSGFRFFTDSEKYTIHYSGNNNFTTNLNISRTLPIDATVLPQVNIVTKKSLIKFLQEVKNKESRKLVSYRNLYRRLYIHTTLDVRGRYFRRSNALYNLTDVNFLIKERLYTKLKYSRSPAYDIVSGGAAALLAGFVGFLISEKYGFELVDSGDFYYLFMYCVFISFSLRPLLTSLSFEKSL